MSNAHEKNLRVHQPRNPVTIPMRYNRDEIFRRSNKPLFNVVSTFAGGGGSSTGYRLAGGRVVFINEVVAEAVETYRANYPDTPIEQADIRKYNRSSDAVEALFLKHGIKKGELDILDGSPPCSPFSSAAAGRKKKDKDPNALVAYSDIQQKRIDMLIHDFVFMANVMQPKVCIFENVPEIAGADQYLLATDRLRRHGYLVNNKELMASDYGAPQNRERLITIAVRKDVAEMAAIEDEDALFGVFPAPTIKAPLTVRQALEGVTHDEEQRQMLLSFARRGAEYELIKLLPHSPAEPCRVRDVIPTYTSNFLLTRASWEHPCTTITATGATGRGGVLHPDEDRVFTIPELRRLFGLPDDFKLTGTFDQKAERIGRMVPPALTMAVAFSVYDRLLVPNQS